MVITAIHLANRDKTVYFDTADTFDPERYLDANGQLDLSKDNSMSFGLGKICHIFKQ